MSHNKFNQVYLQQFTRHKIIYLNQEAVLTRNIIWRSSHVQRRKSAIEKTFYAVNILLNPLTFKVNMKTPNIK